MASEVFCSIMRCIAMKKIIIIGHVRYINIHNMAPRLSIQTPMFDIVFFCIKILKKFAILT